MGKKLFLFPGQGSQEIGMGRDLFSGDAYFCKLIDRASELTRTDLKTLCLKGPEKKLVQARYLQPLIVAISLALLRHTKDKGINPDFVLGHSLGEITALAAAGVVDDNTALALCVKRGELMDEAAGLCDGGMIAVLSLAAEKIEHLIDELGLNDKLFIANDNTPEQVVLSGAKSSLDKFSERARREGGACKKINVAGPWHSPFLKQAYHRFQSWVEAVEFREPRVPLILNATAVPEADPVQIKQLISSQLYRPVYFRQCMEYCKSQTIDIIFELGPGRVLCGLARANGFMRGVRVYAINDLKGLTLAGLEVSA